jgi:Uma2 family endonuclease
MKTAQEIMSRAEYREVYADVKPNWELIAGVPEQKTMPTWLHGILQTLIAQMLTECGYITGTEVSLEVSEEWEPVPDVIGVLALSDTVYQSTPPAVVVEILSPADRFSVLQKKCRKYAEWGVVDILVIDPIERIVYHYLDGLVEIHDNRYGFDSIESDIEFLEIWRRLDLILVKRG